MQHQLCESPAGLLDLIKAATTRTEEHLEHQAEISAAASRELYTYASDLKLQLCPPRSASDQLLDLRDAVEQAVCHELAGEWDHLVRELRLLAESAEELASQIANAEVRYVVVGAGGDFADPTRG